MAVRYMPEKYVKQYPFRGRGARRERWGSIEPLTAA